MSMAKKMAERTSGVQADRVKRLGPITDDKPVTSTGRLLDVQVRVNEALDRADAAEERASQAEAARLAIEASFTETKKQLERLENSSSAAAGDVDLSSLV